jgi:hypothetical protein
MPVFDTFSLHYVREGLVFPPMMDDALPKKYHSATNTPVKNSVKSLMWRRVS